MTYKLFIDDERFPVDDSWVIVRSSQAAIDHVLTYGLPEYISFDHDLGGDDTAMKFVNWLAEWMLDTNQTFTGRKFDFYVHSQNPVGANNIRATIRNITRNI